MVTSSVADILSVPWSISDMERHLDTILRPRETKSLVKASLDIFREVKATCCGLFVDVSLHSINVVCEIKDIESQVTITNVSVGNKANFNFKARI